MTQSRSLTAQPERRGRRRVLMVQPSLQPPGGGNAVAAWTLHALQDDYDLGVLSWTPIELEEVNRFYGTRIRPLAHALQPVPRSARAVLDRLPMSLTLLKRALLFRRAQQISAAWDVLITMHNEGDFGRRGIQYVYYPAHLRPRPATEMRWYHGSSVMLDAYYAATDRIARFKISRMRQNLTLAVSDWTGAVFKHWHGESSVTVYPPVHASFDDIPWDERINGFLCVGRVSPEKRLEVVIDMVSAVRRRHPDVTLRLVGTLGRDAYSRTIRERVEREGPWVSLTEDVSRVELLALMPRFRYGIHGMLEEHFGMAPAEMVAAGCIVFVPRGGGQVEIVGDAPLLTYRTGEEGVVAIGQVLDSPEEQARLRAHLSGRKDLFSTERFVGAVREIVGRFPG